MERDTAINNFSFLGIQIDKFNNITTTNTGEVYHYIHEEIVEKNNLSIIFNYIEQYFNTNSAELSLNNFCLFLCKCNITFNSYIYDAISSKNNIFEACIKIIIHNNTTNKLSNEAIEIMEMYYEKHFEITYTIENDNISETNEEYNISKSNFFNEINKLPLLTENELYELINKYRETKDLKIRDKIFKHNLRLVFPLARKYQASSGMDFEDLVQEGSLGILKAIEDYDPNKSKFSTYATWWIRQKIIRYVNNYSRTIHIPVYKQEKMYRYKKLKNEIFAKTGKYPSDKELAEQLGVPVSEINEYRQLNSITTSLNETISEESDDELIDFIPDDSCENPEQKLINTYHPDIDAALEKLSEDQKNVLKLRYGLLDGQYHTLEEISNLLLKLGLKNTKITSERARQIEARGLEKLHYLLTHPEKKEKNNYINENSYVINRKYRKFVSFIISIDKKILNEILLTMTESEVNFLIEIYGKNIKENISMEMDNLRIENLIIIKIYPKIIREYDKIVAREIINNPKNIILPTNIYYVCDHDKITKDKVDKKIDNLSVEDRYFLSKFYDIYSNTGELIEREIKLEEKLKIIEILKKIENELNIKSFKIYKKRK